jgi:putative tricarboxylic transport membrane protein
MTTGRSLRIGEAILGGLVLVLGLFIAYETTQLHSGPGYAAVGPALFPYMIAAGLVVIGALVLREAFFGHVAHERGMELDWRAVLLVLVGLVVQGILLLPLGWILATSAMFVVVARAFGSRRPLLDAGIGLAITVVAFVLFNYGLGLNLPFGWAFESLGLT